MTATTTTTTTTATTHTDVIPVTADDGTALNLHHVTGERPASRGPVVLVHGAGVRADIFRPPGQPTLVDMLVDDGWDVWLENWRASIDLEPNRWNLDQAAVYDHPALIRAVLAETGADTVKAVVHCQGSTSFAMSAAAGLLPEVTTIVSNAVSLHPRVPGISVVKGYTFTPIVERLTPYLSPRWGLDAPDLLAKVVVGLVRVTHRECDNIVCRMVSFTYGTGFPCLWSHENLTDEIHDWISGEFAEVPLAFFAQMTDSIRRGHMISVSGLPQLPRSFASGPPQTDARFVLFAGRDNRCFLPDSQEATFEFLDGHRRGYHALHVVPGYGHLDMFFGERAHVDVFPQILEELAA
ncbi:MAG: lipase family alpha/beta hydrolase [Ilumatobacteraceae bacterium]